MLQLLAARELSRSGDGDAIHDRALDKENWTSLTRTRIRKDTTQIEMPQNHSRLSITESDERTFFICVIAAYLVNARPLRDFLDTSIRPVLNPGQKKTQPSFPPEKTSVLNRTKQDRWEDSSQACRKNIFLSNIFKI